MTILDLVLKLLFSCSVLVKLPTIALLYFIYFHFVQKNISQVYDFGNRGRCESPSKRSESPSAARSQSPFKINPHQFIAPQKSGTSSPVPAKTAATTPSASSYRSVSPTRTISSPAVSSYRSCSPTRMISSPARSTRSVSMIHFQNSSFGTRFSLCIQI